MEAVSDQPNSDIQIVKDAEVLKEVLDEVTPMDTIDCNEKEEIAPATTNGNAETTTTGDEAIIELQSETSSFTSEKTQVLLSQKSDVSVDNVSAFNSQEEAASLKGEKSGEIKLNVTSELIENPLSDDGEVVTSQEDAAVTITSDEERQSEVFTDAVVTEDESDMFLSPSEVLSSQDRSENGELPTEEEEIKNEIDENLQEMNVPEEEEEKLRDVIELDDSDEDDEGENDGRSEEEEYSEDDSEGQEYGEEYEDEDIQMVVNPASAKAEGKKRQYKPQDLNRLFLSQIKRRSVRMLNCRRYSQKRKIMQIMDDAGEAALELESTIPNNGSPEIVKPKVASPTSEQNDEKENTDPLESNHATESLVSSEESKEIVENSETKSFDDEEEEQEVESISKNDDSIQMIDSEDEVTNESVPEVKTEVATKEKEEKVATESETKKIEDNIKDAFLEDLGSDDAADTKKAPSVTEENLYDDIEQELEPHVVNLTKAVSVEQNSNKEPPSKKKEEEIVSKTEVTTINDVEEKSIKKEINQEVTKEASSKRRRSPSPEKSPESERQSPVTNIQPSKKLRLELENNYGRHDKLLREYIEKSGRNKNVDDVKESISVLESEIKSLDAMLRAKEDEWNNILHMKLVKEEIRLRLVRRKETLEMKLTDPVNILSGEATNNVGFQSSTPLPNKSQTSFNAPLLQESLKRDRNTSAIQNITQQVTMMPLNNTNNSSTQSILQQRANMKGTDLVKEKQAAAKIQRNILPRPTTLPNHEQILRNLAMSSATSTAFQQQQLNELFNGHSKINMGRQGPTKDVSSIIADFREKNPDVPPRRGRRVKGNNVDLFYQLLEQNSRPSSADSSHSASAAAISANAQFKDILAQYAKMTNAEQQLYGSKNSIISALNMMTQAAAQQNSAGNSASSNNKPPPYPEVTLHPVMNASDNGNSSLLHGILTKTQNRGGNNQAANVANAAAAANFTNYSPTLARLLTSPERISPQNLPNYTQASNNSALAGLTASGLGLSNKNSEITITPVVNSQSLQQTLLQQQQKFQLDDDNDDNSTDRLVIDEGDNQQSLLGRNTTEEMQESEVPECQGCRKREAQFVCAGCGNQWYCSRECQVQAWDEHSENCSG
ncbi:probable serine/threonine-protein kinase kinX isoform X2 [Culicoides brevitarsis]|uniref:probable serine/threonine-protein kinase kinX isoform X2 n=1 Tax=Culicoides brevitarsis TaxID=469753 RepID=UPI00307BE386